MIDELIQRILDMPEVDDIYRRNDSVLADGRRLLVLNIYFKKKPQDPPALGVSVRDGVAADDLFGGA